MTLCYETISFLKFVMLGGIFSVIFDFFRALRKFKNTKNKAVYIQDILYFIIIGIILLLCILNMKQETFRLYLILAIVLGAVIYITIVGNKVLKIFLNVLKCSNTITQFIVLPVRLYISLFDKQLKKIKKYFLGCCKKISYMINFYHKKLKIVVKQRRKIETKEGREKNDEKRKQEC